MSLRSSLSVLVAVPFAAVACVNVDETTQPLPDDALPLVEGLSPAVDEDPAVGAVRYTLTARVSDVKLAEGTSPVQAWTYNGTVPGPLLQARVGDDVTVVFTNELPEATTIHWHGMRVPNDMDGVVNGELGAVEPGESFTYHFIAPDAGTFWFHPHMRTNVQIERGLQGMFVVHEVAEDAPDVDADRAFIVDDIYLDDNGEIAPFGQNNMEVMHGRYGNALLTNGSDAVPELSFAPAQVERWRFVNTANARTMVLRFPGLSVRRIGADGGLLPQSLCEDTAEVVLPVGARVELEVRLADGAVSGSLVTVVPALDANDNVVELELPLAEVALDDAREASARRGHTASPPLTLLDDGPVTHTLKLSGANVNGGIEFSVNDFVWPEHEDWSVVQNDIQIIEVVNNLMMEHPFHLHGQFFQVMSRSGAALDDAGRRDTTLIRGGERVRIATRFDNPGMWMVHCHNLEHEENGMMSMVMVEPAESMSEHM